MGVYLGIDAKAYYSTTGVGGTWVLLPIIGDVRIPLQHGEAEVKDRSSSWTKVLVGLKNASVTFRLTRRTGNAVYEVLRDAWINRTKLGFAFMSEAIATVGSEGLQADMVIVGFDLAEPDEEAATVEVTLKPSALSSIEPTFTEITV